MSSGQLRSYLASRVVEGMDCERVKREAWCNNGDLVLMQDQIAGLSLDERCVLEKIATRQYGRTVLKGK